MPTTLRQTSGIQVGEPRAPTIKPDTRCWRTDVSFASPAPVRYTGLGTQKAALLPPSRGYLVRRNQRTALVQTVLTDG